MEAVLYCPNAPGQPDDDFERAMSVGDVSMLANDLVHDPDEPVNVTPIAYHRGQLVSSVLGLAKRLFPHHFTSKGEDTMRQLALDAFRECDIQLGQEDAVAWANGFLIPKETVESDERLFQAHGFDFDQMVKRRLITLAPNRLSRARIESTITLDNPERAKLFELSDDGIPLLLDPNYIPNGDGVWPSLAKSYTATSSAVNRCFMENFHAKGLSFVLTKATVKKVMKGVGLSKAGWAKKEKKDSGRPLNNGSIPGGINSEYTKLAGDKKWGPIQHPTLEEIVRMILDFYDKAKAEDPSVTWDDIVLWKMDLKGAFTLISFAPEAVRNMCLELTGDLVMFFLCGIFGWTGTPAAFQVITRALVWELTRKIHGQAKMYVDDIIGVSLRKNVRSDMQITRELCCRLLGQGAVEDKKTEIGRRIKIIGFTVDLDICRVGVAHSNLCRALGGFMNTDLSSPVSMREMQRLASWGSRYGTVCVYMRPLVRALYAETKGRSQHSLITLRPRTVVAIRVFRALLLLTGGDETNFTRSLESFRLVGPQCGIIVDFDASLTGIGIIWYLVQADGSEVPVGACKVDISSLGFKGKPEKQNTAEFIAATLGMVGVKKLGFTHLLTKLRGDSITALTWSSTKRFRGDLVVPAAIVFVVFLEVHHIVLVPPEHTAAVDHWRADELSREGDVNRVAERDKRFEGVGLVDLDCSGLVGLCRPDIDLANDDTFIEFWLGVHQLVTHL
jgi:hypothetical protein